MTKIDVKDKVVFVTGASREKGIGRALVEEAIKRGAAKVYATARQISQLEDLVAKYNGKVIPIELDVTNIEQIKKIAQQAKDTQILMNNAGVASTTGCFFNYSYEKAKQEMDVNFFGPLNIINIFSEYLLKNAGSVIVNVISIAGLYPSGRYMTYSASKAALFSLNLALRQELREQQIPVVGVYPGPIDTDMAAGVNAQKESPQNVAMRVFDSMEQGKLDITTDALSDKFASFLQTDPKVIDALRKEFSSKASNS